MSKYYVSTAELARVSGSPFPDEQEEWLRRAGIPFRGGGMYPIVRAANWPSGLPTAQPRQQPKPEPQEPADVTIGDVYIVDEGNDGSPVKVGWASFGAANRMPGLQTGNPRPLRLVYCERVPYHVEPTIHFWLKDSRMVGEWFERTEMVRTFIAEAKECGYHAALERLQRRRNSVEA